MKLKNQILIALFISGLFPLAIAFIYAIWHSSVITKELSLDTADQRLEVTAEKLSAYFNSRLIEIEMLARNPQVQRMDFSIMRPYLMQNLQFKKQHYEKFIVGHTDGSFHNTAGGNPHLKMLRTSDDKSASAKPKNIRKRDYWKYTVGNNSTDQRRLYISNPMISYTTEVKQIVVTSSIHNSDGKTVGLLGGSLPWEKIHNIIQELERHLVEGFSGQAKLALISKDGTYWYHWNPNKVIHLTRDEKGNFLLDKNGEKQTIKTNILDSDSYQVKNLAQSIISGKDSLISIKQNNSITHNIFKPILSSGYILQLTIPDSVLSAPTWSLVNMLLGVFFIATIIVISLTFFISKQITSPLLSFTSSVEKVKHGKLDKVDIFSRTSEFNHLVNAYNQMIKIIKQREQSLTKSEERFSLAMQGANDGLWDWNILTDEVYYSPRWKQMLGYEKDELESKMRTWELLLHPDDQKDILESLDNYIQGKASLLNKEFRMIHRDGHVVYIHTRGVVTCNDSGKAERMVGTSIDITARKEYESQLHELNTNLEKRVEHRTHELENLNKELILALDNAENSSKAKGNFLANMSHEIRTPMNGIIGLTELVLRTELNPVQSEYLTKLKASADSLLHILNDILDFSKIEAGKLDIESISFNFLSAIENVISLFNVKAKEKNIELILDINKSIPEHVIGDQFRLTQILSNLTSNAIKFTEKGSVTINIQSASRQGFITFSIIDTGVGIPDKAQSDLFKSFTQADNSTSRKYGGTGLGLAISKHLIKMMQGSIELQSKEGYGTRISFTLHLPIDTALKTGKETDEIIKQNRDSRSYTSDTLVGVKTLLVEDVKTNQLIANEFFTQAGMLVSIANNGKEAVEMTMLTHYDLIIMDIQMPEMDGYEATRLIRCMKEYSNTPIIAMTANAMQNDIELSLQSGMNGHISKPLDVDNVISDIERYYSRG